MSSPVLTLDPNAHQLDRLKSLGWKPQLPDFRDRRYAAVATPSGQPIDLSAGPHMPPIYDQEALGSCTANAIAAVVAYTRSRQGFKPFQTDHTPSRLQIYYGERAIEGSIQYDAGAVIRDGFKVINASGVCGESIWPYNISQFAVQPSPKAVFSAAHHKALTYAAVTQNLNSILAALEEGLPVVYGFTVYSYFMSNEMTQTGIARMPQDGEQVVGGHAVVIVGYGTAPNGVTMFKVRNSWGPYWGLEGHFWMPIEYVTNPYLAADFWVLERIAA